MKLKRQAVREIETELSMRTVNLSELATGFSGPAKMESPYQQLQRFFRRVEVDYDEIARLLSG